MSLFSRSNNTDKAKAAAKAAYEEIVRATKEEKPVERARRTRLALRLRSQIDRTFIDGAKQYEIYDQEISKAVAAGENRPEPPKSTTFKVIKSTKGNYYSYLPEEYSSEIFKFGGLYQTMEINSEQAIEQVQAVAHQVWNEIGAVQEMECLRFLREEQEEADEEPEAGG